MGVCGRQKEGVWNPGTEIEIDLVRLMNVVRGDLYVIASKPSPKVNIATSYTLVLGSQGIMLRLKPE